MAQKPFAFALVLFALMLSSYSVSGQGTTARVTGTVIDSAGGAIPAATVTLTSEGTNSTSTTETDNSGDYVFDLIQPRN